jgi:hypothetical protein
MQVRPYRDDVGWKMDWVVSPPAELEVFGSTQARRLFGAHTLYQPAIMII